MKKNESKKGQKGGKGLSAMKKPDATGTKAAKVAAVAAPAPEATTATEVAPIAAPTAQERQPKAKKAAAEPKAKKASGLDAAAQVIKDAGQPMNTKTMVETMLAKGLWQTDGKTPAATIYAAILREIQVKGSQARFKKTDRGLFTLNA